MFEWSYELLSCVNFRRIFKLNLLIQRKAAARGNRFRTRSAVDSCISTPDNIFKKRSFEDSCLFYFSSVDILQLATTSTSMSAGQLTKCLGHFAIILTSHSLACVNKIHCKYPVKKPQDRVSSSSCVRLLLMTTLQF